MLDDLAWLFNIRGSDVAFNPVVIAYALVGLESAYLFIEPTRISPAILGHLGEARRILILATHTLSV